MGSARAVLLVLGVVFGALAWVSAALAGAQSYTTPGAYVFTVPAGVTSVEVVAAGGSGGTGGGVMSGVGGAGGLGSVVEGTLAVVPGTTLEVNVGGRGDDGPSDFFGAGGGGGGGASDVRTGPTLAERVLVAGGGGGGGGSIVGSVAGGVGGAGGGGAGGSGSCGSGSGEPGGGGTQAAGGAGGGSDSRAGINGDFGLGGEGGLVGAGGFGGFNGGGRGGLDPLGGGAGGGGGGGWYGGGGGQGSLCGGGGGGGSNHAGAGVTNVVQDLATGAGDGSVTLTWDPVPVAALSPAARDFGEVLVDAGPSATQAFTVTNAGDADLVVSAVAIGGADPGEFVVTSDACTGQTLAPAAACQVEVAFDPTATGAKNALLQVTDNAAGSPHTATLTGIGVVEAPIPLLTALSPASGGAGTLVTITGEGFAGATDVLFGDVEAAFAVLSDTQIRATAPGQPLAGAARAPQGLASAVPVVVVGPGGESNALPFTYTAGIGVPGPCDPLVNACAGPSHGQAGTAPFAAPSDGGDGPAVGHARMPNLRASVSAAWRGGAVRVTVRVLVSKPRLVGRWFLVRVRIPFLDASREVRVRAQGKHVLTLRLRFSGPASAIGKHVLVRVDPTNRILETRRKDNTASARIA